MPTPPRFIAAKFHREWRALYRGFRSASGGGESISRAYWLACAWFSEAGAIRNLGPKDAFDLAKLQNQQTVDMIN